MKEVIFYVVCLFIVLGIGGCIWVTQSHFEAKTYARLTGKDVTTWDAMWLELRVQEQAKD